MKKYTLKQTLKELEDFKDEANKQIDDNPFIRKNIDWLDRLFGIYKSPAQIMKEKVEFMHQENRLTVLKNAKILNLK